MEKLSPIGIDLHVWFFKKKKPQCMYELEDITRGMRAPPSFWL